MSSLTAYNVWEYLYPARPEKAVAPSLLGFYEAQGWIGQLKKNGTCTVLGISPEKEIYCFDRHKEPQKAWKASWLNPALKPFLELPEKWFVFEPELLHSKTKGIKDTLYLFEILVADSEFLLGTTWEERQKLIRELFPNTRAGEPGCGYDLVEDSNLWLAKTIPGDFRRVFDSLTREEDEGLVLKNPKALLEFCYTPSANSRWQVKCRKTGKNFSC